MMRRSTGVAGAIMRAWGMIAAVAAALAAGVALAATDAPPADGQPAPAEAAAPPFPAPPGDVRAAKAYAVFDAHCAGCHQTGKLKIPAPARPIANLLALDEVARREALVRPGLPDASPLYTVMLRQHATIELDSAPDASQIQAVRDWIADLPEPAANCDGRPKISQQEIEQAVAGVLAATDEPKRKDLRFVTLNHLADACVPPSVLAGYRQAVAKIVNTLSWGPEPIRLEAFGPDDTLIKLDLSEFGWVGAHWDKIVQAYPYAALASSRLSETTRRQVGSTTPAVRADWLAHAAIGTQLYARLLGLPGRMANLQRILNVDIEADIRHGKARRAGLAQSAVMRANRLVERHPTRNGSLWLAYDFATGEGRQNLLANPLGPTATSVVKVPFKHDETRALFTLPNGFFAFSQNDARGDRLDTATEAVEREALSWLAATGGASGCMACHRQGPFAVVDAVRAQTEADTSAPAELKDQILALYAPQAETDQLVAEDQARYAAAQRKAGVDPTLTIGGLEPVTALAAEYTGDVGLMRLAAEAGLTPAQTRQRLDTLPPEQFLPARRILAATASRAEADRILVRLAPDAGAVEAAAVPPPPAEPLNDLELILWTRSEVYEVGQLATFHARSSQDCHLTLISLDRAGQATVLFPNEFEQNNLLVAGKEFTLPAEGAAYQFRLREKGRETLVGVCQTVLKTPEGVQHDFERQRFTMLGDWRAHLAQLPRQAGRAPTAVEPARGRQARSRGRAAAEAKSEQKPTPPVDQQARAAISYEIR